MGSVTPDYLRPTLEIYFRERETGIYPPERLPWAFPGWQDEAHDWIKQQVAARGQEAAEAGRLDGSEPLRVSMTLEIAGLGLVHTVDGEIALE